MQIIEVAISTVMCAESKLGIISLLSLTERTRHGMLVVSTSASTLKLIDVVKVVTYFLYIKSDLFCSCCSELFSFACTKGSNSQRKQQGSDQTGSSFPPMRVVYDIQRVCIFTITLLLCMCVTACCDLLLFLRFCFRLLENAYLCLCYSFSSYMLCDVMDILCCV